MKIQLLLQKFSKLRSGKGDKAKNARNSVFSIADFGVNAVVLLVATPIYLHHLGAEVFGLWVLLNTVLGFGGMFSFGMGQATLKFVSKYNALNDRAQVSDVIRGTWGIYLSLGTLGSLVLFFAAQPLFQGIFTVSAEYQEEAVWAMKLAAIGLPIIFTGKVFDSALKGFERYDYASNVNIAMSILRHSLQVAAVLLGYGLLALVAAAVISQVFSAVIKSWFIKRKFLAEYKITPAFRMKNYREVFDFSLYSWLMTILGTLRNNGDRLIIGSLLGATSLAYYDIAQRILVQVYNLVLRASGYLFPYSSRLYEEGRMVELRKNYDSATMMISVVTIAMILPLFIVAYPLLEWWLGVDAANNSAFLMQILAIRYALYPLSIVNTYFLLGSSQVKSFAKIQALSTVFMLVMVYLLTREYGIVGACLGQCCVVFVILLNRTYIENRIFGNWRLLPHVTAMLATIGPLLITALILPDFTMCWSSIALGATCVVFSLIFSFGVSWLGMRVKFA